MGKENRFISRAIAPAALLLAISLALVFLSGCGGTLDVRVEPTAAPTEAASRIDADVRDAKHIETDAEVAALPAADRADKAEAPIVVPAPAVEETRPSETVSLDETWNRYTNYGLGFSLKVPKTMVSYNGSCKWNEENGDRSYRPKPAAVPVKIFEDVDSVTIAPEYLYELSGATSETNDQGGSRLLFAECNQVPNSLALIQDLERPWFGAQVWKVVAVAVHNDKELDAFIKSRYGSGCSVREKEASGQDGVYRVRIQGDGKDLSETQCPLNGATMVRYAPEANKVIAWDLGQAYTFLADESFMTAHDQEMIESFRFLTEASAEPSADAADPYAGWTTYTNDAYGFSFKYPLTFGIPHWELSEEDHVVKLCKGTTCLVIGYLGAGEDIILRSGVPAGTLEERGTVDTLGQTVSRAALVFEGKDKAVLYNGAQYIEAGDLSFVISLDELGRIDYVDVELSAELQIEVDAIIASLELAAVR
jgi:hypothetical protein